MNLENPFKWHHFKGEIILLCVRWYLRYALSYRDLEEMMLERGLEVDHSTICRWVHKFSPELDKRCRRHLKPTNDSYRVDETYRGCSKYPNKLESSNKFGKAVFHGNNQEFQLSTKEEQLIADGCRRLIENSIICWNYLYLSKLISDTKSGDQKTNLINTIKNGSVVAWRHINLQGEYDFSEEKLKDSIEFSLPELLELQVA